MSTNKQALPLRTLRDPFVLLACGLGSGAARFAPGTFGTLVAIPLYYLVVPLSVLYYALLTIVLFAAGVWLCGYAADRIGVHDHPGIVWDEIVGYLVTMFMAPAGWQWIVVGFLLFRLFDIWKPWPIRWLDRRVSGGLGIMVDDVLAGIYAAVLLQLLYYYGPY